MKRILSLVAIGSLRPRVRTALLTLASICLYGALIGDARALSYSWTGLGADDSWEDIGNWEGGPSFPGSGDTADFASVSPRFDSIINSNISISGITYTVPGYSLSVLASVTIAGGISADIANAPDLVVDGDLSLGGDAVVTTLSGTGQVNLDTHTVTVSQGGTFEGAISGTGGSLVKSGTGTLTLMGTSDYTGATTVEAGMLRVDGQIFSDVLVQDGATFGGDGIFGSVVLESGAVLVPIDCFDGETLTWESGATMVYSLGLETGILELVGDLLKSGTGPFAFTFQDDGWEIGQEYTLILFAGKDFIQSDFSFTNSGGFDGDFVLEETSLSFTVTAVPEPSACLLMAIGTGILIWSWGRGRSSKPV